MLLGVTTEYGQTIFADPGSQFGVRNPETFFFGGAENTDFSLMAIVVHLVGGFTDVVEREHCRQRRNNLSFAQQRVGRPGLSVVRKV